MKWLVFHLKLLLQVPNSFVMLEMLDMQDKNILQNVFTVQYGWHHLGLTVNNRGGKIGGTGEPSSQPVD